ncbi:Phox homologous domain, partial [Globisporangium splendens]
MAPDLVRLNIEGGGKIEPSAAKSSAVATCSSWHISYRRPVVVNEPPPPPPCELVCVQCFRSLVNAIRPGSEPHAPSPDAQNNTTEQQHRRTSMVQGQMRVSVIGSQTENADSKSPYTMYRTAVNYRGQCYQRLLRYRQFRRFSKKLRVRDPIPVKSAFPKKQWTRKGSLRDDVVEARQVLLNEYMNEVVSKDLTDETEERLLKLLKVGKYDDTQRRKDDNDVPRKAPLVTRQSERPTVDVYHEMDRESAMNAEQSRSYGENSGYQRNPRSGATDTIGGVATIVNNSITFPQVTSNAETVTTEDDERSMDGDVDQVIVHAEPDPAHSHSGEHPTDEDEDEDELDARGRSSSAASVTPLPPKKLVDASPIRPSVVFPPARQAKKVNFHMDGKMDKAMSVMTINSPKAEEQGRISPTTLSPERKYRSQIEKRMSTIDDILASSSDGLAIPPEYHALAASVTARDRAGST